MGGGGFSMVGMEEGGDGFRKMKPYKNEDMFWGKPDCNS